MIHAFNALAVVTLLVLSAPLVAQPTIPDIVFETNADLLKMPNDIHVGEVAGVGANSKGQIFVYTRTGHPYADARGQSDVFSRRIAALSIRSEREVRA